MKEKKIFLRITLGQKKLVFQKTLPIGKSLRFRSAFSVDKKIY